MQDKQYRPSILYLTYDGLTDTLGQSQILPYLKGLADQGYPISIISFEKKDRYSIAASGIKKLTDSHKINWIPLSYSKRPPVLSTLYDLFKLWRTIRSLMHTQKFSIVHCRSYLTAIIGLRMKRKFGTKFLFDMRGFWADERVEGGLWDIKNPLYSWIYRYFKTKEQELLRDADQIIVLTDAAKKVLHDWKVTQPVTVIPCCVDLDLFNRTRVNNSDQLSLRAKLGIHAKQYVLLYLGSLGTWYMLPEMLAYFAEVQKHHADAKFLILTPDLDKVPTAPNIISLTTSRDQVPHYISISNACVCFIKPSFSKTGSSATKMAEVLAMEVPVITNNGWGDVAFLGQHVQGLKTTDPMRPTFVATASEGQSDWFKTFFSLESGVERYSKVYENLAL